MFAVAQRMMLARLLALVAIAIASSPLRAGEPPSTALSMSAKSRPGSATIRSAIERIRAATRADGPTELRRPERLYAMSLRLPDGIMTIVLIR
jgi:hypothetical protein